MAENSNDDPSAAPPSSSSSAGGAEAAPPPPPPSDSKVKVHLVAVGSAPILKKTKFTIRADQRFASVIQFVRKMLKVDTVFLYCHSAFVPAPDQLVGDLRDCLAVRDELVIHYSLQEAWG